MFDVDAALAARRPAHTLERPFYVDAAVYEADLERIWYREWLFVGHAASIPRPGDYRTVTIGAQPIVIVRNDDGSVRAMHNVCRHRGSLVCTDDTGTARRRMVCPYHQWAYELDGSLAKARNTPPGFRPAHHGLLPVGCQTVSGLVFVSLAADPPPFEPLRTLATDYLAPFEPERAIVAAESVTVEAGNWKLVMENNRECHHCRGAHPELCRSFPEAPLHTGGSNDGEARALADIVELGESLGLPSRFLSADDRQYRFMRMPLVGDTVSMTLDGRPAVARRFGSIPAEPLGDVLFYHYPTSWSHWMSDHAVTFRLLPLGPTHTQLTTTWLVPAGSVEGVDYDVDHLTSVWRITNEQDRTLVEATQRGVASPAYRPGPYAPDDELGVIQFVDWYAGRMDRTAPTRSETARP